MRTLVWLVALVCVTISVSGQNSREGGRGVFLGYELYTWQGVNGEWDSCVLYTTNSRKTVKQIFDEKITLRGFDQLKRKLDTLPKGARVSWLGGIPSGPGPKPKGSERLGYPPKEQIQEIRRYAEGRDIKIVIHGSPDGLP